MSVQGSLDTDLDPGRLPVPKGAADTRAPSWGEAAAASWRLAQDDTPEYNELNRLKAYDDVEAELLRMGYARERYRNPEWARWYNYYTLNGQEPERLAQIWKDVAAEKAKGRFADIPAKTQQEFEIWARRRKGERDRDQATAGRGGFGSSIVPSLAFGLTRIAEPENLATLPLGGGGRTIAGTLGRQFMGGVQATALQAPQLALTRQAMGEGYSSEDLLTDLAIGGATQAGFVGVQIGAGKAGAAGKAVYDRVIPLEYRMARALEQAVPTEFRPPELQAAIHVLTREGEVDLTNPYAQTFEALDSHVSSLRTAMAELEAMPKPAPLVAPVRERAAPRSPNVAGSGDPFAQVARDVAATFDLDPVDVAAIMSYESGGTFDPRKMGGKGGNYMGLIQFGPWERNKYGIDANSSPEQWTRAIVSFLNDRGFKKGMGTLDLYSTINAGKPGRYNASDGNGTVRSHHARILAEHRDNGARWVGGEAGTPLDLAGQTVPQIRDPALDAERPVLQVRPEVLAAEQRRVNMEGRPVDLVGFRPDEIGVDAELMQFKSGGDQFGVTERLQGVRQWDPIAAGTVVVWEGLDGRRLIADGHQRLGLAKRIQAADPGQDIRLNAFVLREADGVSAIDARIMTALKNIGEGTGTATDAGKVFRAVGLDNETVNSRLPPRSALVRDGKALARLSDEAFGAAVNEVIPEGHAAAIGHLAPDPATHMALVDLLHQVDPPNRRQAEAVIRQALEAGFHRETQDELFGGRDMATALFAQRAKLLDKTIGELRKLKGAFQVAARNAEALDAAGNRIDVGASEIAAAGNAKALGLVEQLALRKGNAVNALFNEAAGRLAAGEPLARVTRDLVARIRELDLERAVRDAGGSGDAAVGSGRAGEPYGETAGDGQDLTPATIDELEAAGQGGFALFDEPAHQAFDDPAGAGVKAVADSAWHDIRLTVPDPKADPGARLSAWIGEDPARARAAYEAIDDPKGVGSSEGGRVLNVDLARELSPEYRAARNRSQEVHEASSAFIKRLYAEKLREEPAAGLERRVLFTAGGTGAGKSTGLSLLGPEASNAGIIYDTNMNSLASSIDKIDQALAAGWPVRVVYTWRDPIEALVQGALPRAERMGRTVPIDKHIETHVNARRTMDALVQHYAEDPRVAIFAVDNSRGKHNAQATALENIPQVNEVGLYDQAYAETEAAFRRGDIGQATLDGTVGRRADGAQGSAAARGPGGSAGAGGEPQPQRDGAGPLDPAQLIDLDDGRGPRPVSEIDAELKRGEDGIDAIRSCQ